MAIHKTDRPHDKQVISPQSLKKMNNRSIPLEMVSGTMMSHSAFCPGKLCLRLLLFTLVGCCWPQLGSATENHPISIIEADVYVNRRATQMRLKLFAEDLELIQGVEPGPDGLYDPQELKQAAVDHGDYLSEKISVRDGTGKLLKPEVTEIIDVEIPPDGIYSGELMNHALGYIIEYDYAEPPEFLTFQHDVVDEDYLFPAEMTLLLKQAGTDNIYKANMKLSQPETIRFDWDAPPISDDASDREWEQWFNEQREKTLGITSYSSVYSFIYITDHEVRHEVLIPLASLATEIEFQREDEAFLSVSEQDAAARQIENWLQTGQAVAIDDREISPRFDRIDFYGLDLRDFAMQAAKRPVSMANGRVGIIMSFPSEVTPQQVEVTWEKFNAAITTVEAVLIAFDDVSRHQFSTFLEDNTLAWENPGREPVEAIQSLPYEPLPLAMRTIEMQLPVVSVVCGLIMLIALSARWFGSGSARFSLITAAAALLVGVTAIPIARYPVPISEVKYQPRIELSDQQAAALFSQLHQNMFRAFGYYDEEAIYDGLAKSMAGDLLRETYLQIRRSLEVKEQSGAVSKIDDVRLLEGEVTEPLPDQPLEHPEGFAFRCHWELIGTIEHWGHIHQRTNQYTAVFNVQPVGDTWKITAMKVLEQKQGRVKTSLRKF